MKYGWNQFFIFVYAINRVLSTNKSHFHLLIGAQDGDSLLKCSRTNGFITYFKVKKIFLTRLTDLLHPY